MFFCNLSRFYGFYLYLVMATSCRKPTPYSKIFSKSDKGARRLWQRI